ncbi:Rieske 2Fe-2S domain-containing protein [bacterium]|nr:Rieske 2Fe-2S domain-containing protein [bacterium]
MFQRFAGKPATKLPKSNDCWSFKGNKLTIDLAKFPDLSIKGTALRCEGEDLTDPVLVIHGDDGKFHAFRNKCTHGERRMDPVPGGFTVQCCSVGKSTFDYDGHVLKGSADKPIIVYPVELMDDNKLIISITE